MAGLTSKSRIVLWCGASDETSCKLHTYWHDTLTISLKACRSCFCWLQPRLLHMNAVTDAIQNVTFMHMPPKRRAVFDVPIEVWTNRTSPSGH